MKLTKSGGQYYAVIKAPSGKTKRIPTQATSLKEAKHIVQAANIADLEMAGKVNALTQETLARILGDKRMTCRAAADQWVERMQFASISGMTIANTKSYVDLWMKDQGVENLPPSAITEKHIAPWVNDPNSEAKVGTRRVKLSAVRSFFQFCAHQGWVMRNPAWDLRINMNVLDHRQKETQHRKPFTDDEVRKLLRATDEKPFWQAAIAFGRYAGLRLGDICQLEWDCFQTPGEMVVWTDKRNKRVRLKLNAQLESVLNHVPILSNKYLFPEERKRVADPKTRAWFSVTFQRICEREDIHGKSFHSLRHAYATAKAKGGATLAEIKDDLGHTSEKTTEGYVHG